MSTSLRTAPLDWTSSDPHLSGNFMPIGPEIEQADLPVISGRIPLDLRGVYMRNGPNPEFKPIAYNYPLDGDGMIHAVYFDNGRARYKNRFVRTAGLAVEEAAGHAVYGSLLRPVPVDQSLPGVDKEPGPFKTGAFISVLKHGDHLLALGEAQPAYEINEELETLGLWNAGTERPIRLGAHNRIHPVTGDMFALAYSPMRPVVTFHHIDPRGALIRSFPLNMTAAAMIHDFVLTETHIVLLVGPAIFDPAGAQQGKPFLSWRPEMSMRICVMGLDGSSPIWLDAEAFYVFHFGNGFDDRNQIVVDYVRHASLALGYGTTESAAPRLHRMRIDLETRSISDVLVGDFGTEFPCINHRVEALRSRFVYVPTLTSTLKLPSIPSSTFNAMVKVNTETGQIVQHDFGNRIAGEAVFIPRGGDEDDGYLAIFAYDPVNNGSQLLLLDAVRPDADPVAVIALPQRVPQGLHGTWIART